MHCGHHRLAGCLSAGALVEVEFSTGNHRGQVKASGCGEGSTQFRVYFSCDKTTAYITPGAHRYRILSGKVATAACAKRKASAKSANKHPMLRGLAAADKLNSTSSGPPKKKAKPTKTTQAGRRLRAAAEAKTLQEARAPGRAGAAAPVAVRSGDTAFPEAEVLNALKVEYLAVFGARPRGSRANNVAWLRAQIDDVGGPVPSVATYRKLAVEPKRPAGVGGRGGGKGNGGGGGNGRLVKAARTAGVVQTMARAVEATESAKAAKAAAAATAAIAAAATKAATAKAVAPQEKCAICLDVPGTGKEVCTLRCGHMFCHTCLKTWWAVSRAKSCPVCR